MTEGLRCLGRVADVTGSFAIATTTFPWSCEWHIAHGKIFPDDGLEQLRDFDAIYLGVDKLKQAKYERKALLIISDGGDNRSRYTEGELRRVVRESDVQIYSIGIFDQYAPTTEEQMGPILLNDICDMTGGRMFRVLDINDLGDIASRISAELRNEYVIGYRPSEVKQDGNWRKLKIRLVPPPGLPSLTVHNRQGYYAPSQ